MYISLLALATVSFICLCFFKKRFWENRYLVLLISASVALLVTLATNYATRGNLGTMTKIVWEQPIQVMNLNDSLIDSSAFTIDEELSFKEHLHAGDTLKPERYSRHLFYYSDGLRVGFAIDDDLKSRDWDLMYIGKSDTDTTAYYTKKRVFYNKRNSKWIADFSLPHLQTIKCLYLPPTEYAMIPDSLLREIPSKFTYKINWD